MKPFIQQTSLLALAVAFFALTPAQAQVQLGVSGNYFNYLEEGVDFSNGLWGGGITGRYFVAPKFAVGLNGRYLVRSEQGVTISLIPVTGQAEFFLTEGKVRPYLGAEAGIYISRAKISIAGVSASDSDSNLGAAPKLGFQIMFTDAIGLDINAGYHLLFHKADQNDEISKTLILGAGLVFNLGKN